MADNDGVIELDLDLPAPTNDGKKAAKELEQVDAPQVDEALASLKKQLEEKDITLAANQVRLAAAEASAREANDAFAKSKGDVRSANLSMVYGAIESVKRDIEVLEANYANAAASGDFTSAGKYQTASATAAAKLVQLETGKEAMEAEAKNPPVRRVDPPRDPVEAFASQLSPRSAAWIRSHPQCVTDPRLQQRMLAAHNLAMTENLAADTDDYFARVEGIMGFGEDTGESAMSEAAKPTQRRASPPAAPVSRSGTGNGKSPNRVTLTAEEREFASLNNMSDREYAEQKLKLIREGKIH